MIDNPDELKKELEELTKGKTEKKELIEKHVIKDGLLMQQQIEMSEQYVFKRKLTQDEQKLACYFMGVGQTMQILHNPIFEKQE